MEALGAGTADAAQQKAARAALVLAWAELDEMRPQAARGRHVAETAGWYRDNDKDKAATYLRVDVEPGADLSSKGSREDALDRAIKARRSAALRY